MDVDYLFHCKHIVPRPPKTKGFPTPSSPAWGPRYRTANCDFFTRLIIGESLQAASISNFKGKGFIVKIISMRVSLHIRNQHLFFFCLNAFATLRCADPSVDKQHVNGFTAEQAAAPESLSVSIFIEAGSGHREESTGFPGHRGHSEILQLHQNNTFPCLQSFLSSFSQSCLQMKLACA